MFLQSVEGNSFFIVVSGHIGIYAQESAKIAEQRVMDFAGSFPTGINLQGGLLGPCIAILTGGTAFGEIALLHKTKKIRTASCVARSDSVMLVMGREVYNRTLGPGQRILMASLEERLRFLSKHPLFLTWNRSAQIHLAYERRKREGGRKRERGVCVLEYVYMYILLYVC